MSTISDYISYSAHRRLVSKNSATNECFLACCIRRSLDQPNVSKHCRLLLKFGAIYISTLLPSYEKTMSFPFGRPSYPFCLPLRGTIVASSSPVPESSVAIQMSRLLRLAIITSLQGWSKVAERPPPRRGTDPLSTI